MNASNRARIAAGLLVLSGVFGLVSAIRILAGGSQGLPPLPGAEEMGGPPFWAGLMFFALAVAGLFSAFGLWKGQRWGKVVAIVTCAVNAVFGAGDVLGAVAVGSVAMGVVMGLSVLVYVLIIVLVLRRDPVPTTA
ncbi:MAG: hypothetical protein ACH37Z_17975 [Anaerolineae bacterium]|nr:hypothetical protein [Ardenticatenia bacterium]MBK8540259.1 hypothetical protein [Ardenticatenia bacterium]HQZ72715.1 hypothetical protein [Anaerolineae bacterium]HRA21323.1 hypothetical protein [Anaerolineae bacterium]